MAVTLITVIQRFIGLSTDVKPVNVPVGSEFYELDSTNTHVCSDGTNWSIKRTESADGIQGIVQTIALNGGSQAAYSRSAAFAAGADCYLLDGFTFLVSSTPDLTDDSGGFTGISIQTDEDTPTVFLSQANGVKANLIANTLFSFPGPFKLPAYKYINLTCYGKSPDDQVSFVFSAYYTSLGGLIAK